MLFDNTRGCAKVFLWTVFIIVAGLVVICCIPGCAVEKPDIATSQTGIANKSENKASAITQQQLAAKVTNTVDNSQKESHIDNRVSFPAIPPVTIPDEPPLPEFPGYYPGPSAGVIPAALKCKDKNSCPLPASAAIQIPPASPPAPPSIPAPAPAPQVNVNLNPLLIEEHSREIASVEKQYSARLAATEGQMRQQIDILQAQTKAAEALAEKRIQENERRIAAEAKAKESEIRATEEKWRILVWVLGVGAILTLLMKSPIDHLKDWFKNRAETAAPAPAAPLPNTAPLVYPDDDDNLDDEGKQ